MYILLGIVFIILGTLVILYSGAIVGVIGRWSRAEKYMGGTTQGIIIVGFLVVVFGFVNMFGGKSNVKPTITQGFTTGAIK